MLIILAGLLIILIVLLLTWILTSEEVPTVEKYSKLSEQELRIKQELSAKYIALPHTSVMNLRYIVLGELMQETIKIVIANRSKKAK